MTTISSPAIELVSSPRRAEAPAGGWHVAVKSQSGAVAFRCGRDESLLWRASGRSRAAVRVRHGNLRLLPRPRDAGEVVVDWDAAPGHAKIKRERAIS